MPKGIGGGTGGQINQIFREFIFEERKSFCSAHGGGWLKGKM